MYIVVERVFDSCAGIFFKNTSKLYSNEIILRNNQNLANRYQLINTDHVRLQRQDKFLGLYYHWAMLHRRLKLL